MARKPASSQSKGSQGRGGSAQGSTSGVRRLSKADARIPEDSHIFDERTRRDILGVVFIISAVTLLAASLLPAEGLVTKAVSDAMRSAFGIGCYLIPLFLACIGVTFLVRFERQRVPVRVAVGLALILVSVMGLIGVATPAHELDYSDLFLRGHVTSYGGYLGAGIAWVGLTLFGKPITVVLLVGVIVIGIIIIGFSISKLIDSVRRRRAAVAQERANMPSDSRSVPPFARIRRAEGSSKRVSQSTPAPNAEFDRSYDDAFGSNVTTEFPQASQGKRPRRSQTRKGGDAGEGAGVPAASAQGSASSSDIPDAEQSAHPSPQTITRKLSRSVSKDTHRSGGASPKTRSASVPENSRGGFVLPPLSLLASSRGKKARGASEDELRETALRLRETLEDFSISAQVVGWVAGPTVTLFKIDLPSGVRISRVTALNNDIALALAAPGVRIFAPIPGTNYVGIEVPNADRQTVMLGDVLVDAAPGPLQIAIGKDVEGRSVISDLAKMPHLLIGGTTGSGKSVSINAMIMSILMRATPDEVRFIMIDPKRVEFTPYNGIPHLYAPVVTEPKEASSALAWAVAEMDRRLKIFSKVGARNIAQYNKKITDGAVEDETKILPYLVIIIDELADLMMIAGKEVEASICRLAQLARAAGIHLIVATQRPSTKVVTGLIKANITNRIAFNVASVIDSRVILDTAGAENLIGLGDLLFSKPEYAKPNRIQGCYVSEEEINSVVSLLKEQGEPDYHTEILKTNVISLGSTSPDSPDASSSSDDPLLWEAAEYVVTSKFGSTSSIQRRFKVGYSRAGRIMDQLEEKGIVGPANGSKPREVLVDEIELETLKAFEANDSSSEDDRPF